MDFDEVRFNIENGYYDAFSIAFIPTKDTTIVKDETKIRLLDDMNLLNVALTGNPINPRASVTEIFMKSLDYLRTKKKSKQEIEEGELEKMTNKLFVEGKKRGANTVRLHDPLGNFRIEIGTKADSDTAYDVLASLSEKYADDKEAREMLQELLGEAGYFDVAYHQRDSAQKLKRNTVAHAADEFLKEWDPDYREWVEPESPLLTYQPHEGIKKLNNDTGDYDTRDVLPILKDNIEGFEIEDSPIPAGDVSVSYKGAGFQVFAGHDYSVDKSSIIRALNRISKEDVKKGDIKSGDRSLRLSVLKDYIFD